MGKNTRILSVLKAAHVSLTIFLISSCCKKNERIFFPEKVVDDIHIPLIHPLFRQADSLKYAMDYGDAAKAFEHLVASNTLNEPDRLYAFNQLVYLYLLMNRDQEAENLLIGIGWNAGVAAGRPSLQADHYYNKGLMAYHRLEPDSALLYLRKSQAIYRSLTGYGPDHLRTALCSLQIAMVHFEFTTQTDSALSTIPAAYRMFRDVPVLMPYRREGELAMAFFSRMLRMHERGESHSDVALDLAWEAPWRDTVFIMRCMGLKGHLLKKQVKQPEAIALLDSAITWSSHCIHPRRQELYRDLLITLAGRDDSLFFLKKNDLERIVAVQTDVYASTDRLLGYYYAVKNDFQNSYHCYKKFLNRIHSRMPYHNFLRDEANWTLAEACEAWGKYDQALDHQRAIVTVKIPGGEHLSWQQLMLPQYYRLSHNQFVSFARIGQLFFQKYKVQNNKEHLYLASEYLSLADSLLFPGLATGGEEEILTYQSEVGNFIYPVALAAAYEMYMRGDSSKALDLAFRYCERPKSYIMYSGMRLDTMDVEDVPSDLLDSLKIADNKVRKLTWQKSNAAEDLNNVALQFTQADAELEHHYGRLRRQYPRYFRLRVGQPLPILTDVRQSLKASQALVEYSICQSELYVLFITRERVIFYKTDANEVHTEVDKYRSALKGDSRRAYTESAWTLYNLLLKPFDIYYPKGENAELVIVPDRFLYEIPFESLLTAPTVFEKYRDAQYLLHRARITYTPSWKIWAKQRETVIPAQPRLAFFSYDEASESACALLNARQEIASLRSIWGNPSVVLYRGHDCRSDKFAHQSKGFDILHLSLHGASSVADRLDNKLFFKITSDLRYGQCTTDPLYGFQVAESTLNAKLVVLSACETAAGNNTAGEGAYTLSRAFCQAGVPRVLAALWQVSENSNVMLINRFYEYLSNGNPPSYALHRAKSDYILQSDDLQCHPRFWAGMVGFE